jgi:epoxyqueuosine reductase
LATFLAWICSVIFAFFANKIFVFESKSFLPRIFFRELGSFALARISTGLLDIGFMYLFVDVCGFEKLEVLFKLISSVVVIILNFILSKIFVFKRKRKTISSLLNSEGIEFYACVPLSRCKITKEYLLEKNGLDKNSNVIMMLIPYKPRKALKNLTAYASVKDYHLYVERISKRIEAHLKRRYPNCVCKVFADHSPIDEVHAACISGLGFIGDNGLLINEKYSSFVFLAECITDLTPSQLKLSYAKEIEVKECLHCGACKKSCPTACIVPREEGIDKRRVCLSAITQKKGELTDEEIALILKNGSVWGCDACQNACPYTKKAASSPIDFFNEDVISCLTVKTLENMTDEKFNSRPFAWRGKETIKRNVMLWENDSSNKN